MHNMKTTSRRRRTAARSVSACGRSVGRSGCHCKRSRANSTEEFKASVLGAYERGERAISVPRLERLARFYSVPVDQLLPREEQIAQADRAADAPKLAIDLQKLGQLGGNPFEMLVRFLRMIQVQRQDFNGKVITVRGDDTRAIAAMLDVPVDQVGHRLDALDLLYQS